MNWWEILKWLGTFGATAGSLIAFVKVAISQINRDFSKKMDEKFENMNKQLKAIENQQYVRDVEHCRIELNSFLNKVKYHREEIDQQEWQLYYAIYDRYTNTLHQNSYIHNKWERIVDGKNKADNK